MTIVHKVGALCMAGGEADYLVEESTQTRVHVGIDYRGFATWPKNLWIDDGHGKYKQEFKENERLIVEEYNLQKEVEFRLREVECAQARIATLHQEEAEERNALIRQLRRKLSGLPAEYARKRSERKERLEEAECELAATRKCLDNFLSTKK